MTVRHITKYRYASPVKLGEHQMMFRPRESHDLRLVRTRLSITPEPKNLRWLHDVFDNSLAIATFDTETAELVFDSEMTLEHIEAPHPDYALAEDAQTFPFAYSREERLDLVRALERQHPAGEVARWAAGFLKRYRARRSSCSRPSPFSGRCSRCSPGVSDRNGR